MYLYVYMYMYVHVYVCIWICIYMNIWEIGLGFIPSSSENFELLGKLGHLLPGPALYTKDLEMCQY